MTPPQITCVVFVLCVCVCVCVSNFMVCVYVSNCVCLCFGLCVCCVIGSVKRSIATVMRYSNADADARSNDR